MESRRNYTFFTGRGGERFEESLIVELIEKLILFKNFRKNSFFKELVGHTSLIIDLGGSVSDLSDLQ